MIAQFNQQRKEFVLVNNHWAKFQVRTDSKMDYTGLQQTNPHLSQINPTDIPQFYKNNLEKGRGQFDGALRPWPVEGSSSRGKDVGMMIVVKRKVGKLGKKEALLKIK
ncbi:hypothetical protein PIB30_098262, partial [Stylosanthes scabra]|nr:hypothetical protein [Stylosanthes scabra]